MTRELNRVTLLLLALFGGMALSVLFWSVLEAENLLARPDNARNVIERQRVQRGMIVDADGERLAYSREDPSGVQQRVYPVPDMASAVGYYSFTYGTAGVEDAYDSALRGEGLRTGWKAWFDDVLHRPQTGADVRTTLDLDVQRAIVRTFGGRSGAALVVHVPTGRILALVSRPGYDPNQLEASWARLTRDEATSPLLNRATAGHYQPGGALQTVLLAARLGTRADLSAVSAALLGADVPGATEPVPVNGLSLTCLPGTPEPPLTLAEAYLFGCPAPFLPSEELPPARVWDQLDALGLLVAPDLPGFETAPGPLPPPFDDAVPADRLTAELTGQGVLTVTPLQLVGVVAAIANQGNSVPLHIVDAIRPPGAAAWQPVDVPVEQPAVLRSDVAEVLRLSMLQAAAQSPHVARARSGALVTYGHSALAWGGPEQTPYAWFAGFVDQSTFEQAAALAVVVVVEGEGDPGVAAEIAAAAFRSAAEPGE